MLVVGWLSAFPCLHAADAPIYVQKDTRSSQKPGFHHPVKTPEPAAGEFPDFYGPWEVAIADARKAIAEKDFAQAIAHFEQATKYLKEANVEANKERVRRKLGLSIMDPGKEIITHVEWAEAYQMTLDYEKAESQLKAAMSAVRVVRPTIFGIPVFVAYIKLYEDQGKSADGETYAKEICKVVGAWQPDTARLDGYRDWLTSWRGEAGKNFNSEVELLKWRKWLVKLYLKKNRYADALPFIESYADRTDPERVKMATEAIRFYSTRGDGDEAMSILDRNPQIDKAVVHLALDKAAKAAFEAKNYKKAKELLSRLLEMEESTSLAASRVLMRRGNALYNLKEIQLAQADLRAAMAIASKDDTAAADMPWLNDAIGHTEEILAGKDKDKLAKASEYYKIALQLSENRGGKEWGVETARIAFSNARTLHALGKDTEADQLTEKASQAVYAAAARDARFRAAWKFPTITVSKDYARALEEQANASAQQAAREGMRQFQQQTANYFGSLGLEWRERRD